jgi:peroxiredoxin Q/BCP
MTADHMAEGGPRHLRPGDPAPDFALPDADGRVWRLSGLRGRTVIVYFYPRASTPGCTREACDFRDRVAAFAATDAQVLGISADGPPALQRFRDEQSLPFPLLSDESHEVLQAYGAWGERHSYGRTSVGVIRSTVVVGPDGRVLRAYYNVRAAGHVARLEADLRGAAGR